MQDWPVQTMAVSDLVAAMAAQPRLRESLEKFGLASIDEATEESR